MAAFALNDWSFPALSLKRKHDGDDMGVQSQLSKCPDMREAGNLKTYCEILQGDSSQCPVVCSRAGKNKAYCEILQGDAGQDAHDGVGGISGIVITKCGLLVERMDPRNYMTHGFLKME